MDFDGPPAAPRRGAQRPLRSTDGIRPAGRRPGRPAGGGRPDRPAGGRPATGPATPTAVKLRQPVSPPAPVAGTPVAGPAAVPAGPVQAAAPSGQSVRSDYVLPRYTPRRRPERVVRKRHRLRSAVLRSALVLFVLVLGVGGFLSWKAYSKLHKVFHGTSTIATLASKTVVPEQLKTEGDGRVNILLLGIGGPGHDGPDLTDTIVLLSVDPVNHKAVMLSVPRDLWVKQPINYFGSVQKINAAYESGKYHYLGHNDGTNDDAKAVRAGFNNLDQVVKTVLGVQVNYHVLVNFQAFRQAVDTVGGVTVDVPTALVDPTMAWENRWNPVLAPAGVQQMNGVQALLYARSRETTSDFARGQRQRQILVALKDKVLSAGTLSNPAKIDGLMNAFGDNVYSDLSTQGAERLYSIMKGVGDNQIASLDLTDPPHQLVTTDHVGSTSVDRPAAGFYTYDAIQTYVRGQLPDGYIVQEHAPVAVVGATKAAADAAAALLKSYGYYVVSSGTTGRAVLTPSVIDRSDGSAPFTLHYLRARYGAPAVVRRQLPSGVNLPAGPAAAAKFVIMVPK